MKHTMLLQVSWVRHRDIHLLTVGRYTYTSDQRFRAIHHPHTEDWSLQIKYPQHRDSGIYECQISTTPHMSHFVHLNDDSTIWDLSPTASDEYAHAKNTKKGLKAFAIAERAEVSQCGINAKYLNHYLIDLLDKDIRSR
uniref:Ig-like domain-containing protein n=1 Tax=Anopheles dirus TaxID=7168 RepID=A0A182NDU4_9DIPT